MAQIWCFLAVSMIVGSFGITKCNSLELNDAGTMASEDGKAGSDANIVKRDEDCYYPHRCNKRHYCDEPLYCDYALYFGKRKNGDKRLWNKYYLKPSSNASNEQNPFVIQVDYPNMNSKPVIEDFSITYIHVEDKKKSKQIYDDAVFIVAGGIGENFVKLNITSNNPKPRKYNVKIYGKHKKSKKPTK